MTSNQTKWSKEEIRAARHAPLDEILREEGLHLHASAAGNFKVDEYPDIIIKECYWRCRRTEEGGNTLDLLVKVLGMSFAEAMGAIERIKRLNR